MTTQTLVRRVAGLTLLLAPAFAGAQDDKLTIHGSANLAYGKSDKLPIDGVTQDGTSEYLVIALQFGYKVSEKDRVVTQLVHRKVGSSPLNAVTPDILPVWAFYEHRFDNGTSVKAGRSPLPRGLFNEVRYVGTLLPTFRVGSAVYGETLEYMDGIVVRKPFGLGGDWKLDASAFVGGYSLKVQLPTATGIRTLDVRNENSFGTQVFLNTPIEGVRVGAFYNNYMSTPSASVPDAARPKRTTATMYSAEAVFSKVFARSEVNVFRQPKDPNFVDYTSYYVQGGITPTDKITLVTEYSAGTNVVRFAGTPLPDLDLPLNNDLTIGVVYKPNPQVAFKLEGHQVEGYSFDRPVPSIIPPTAPPLVARLAPKSSTYFALASVAFTF